MKVIAAIIAICASVAQAHPMSAEECQWYGGMAGAIASAKNGGMSATELVPQLMTYISSCSANGSCPVKDGQDTKRVIDYVHQVYELETKGLPIDADAVEGKLIGECMNQVLNRAKPPAAMVPDPTVPSTGPQLGA